MEIQRLDTQTARASCKAKSEITIKLILIPKSNSNPLTVLPLRPSKNSETSFGHFRRCFVYGINGTFCDGVDTGFPNSEGDFQMAFRAV